MANPPITINGLVPINGRAKSSNYIVPPTSNTSYLFDAMYRPTTLPVQLSAYWPDTRTKNTIQNYNTAYTALEWSQPLWAYMGDSWVLYEIVTAPAGMTLNGALTLNGQGYYVPADTYANLFWNNPVAGVHRVIIRATDQTGHMVTFDWWLTVNITQHHFMALNATGDGSGSSPSNYCSYANTIKGVSTLSPSQGKVLHVKGDDYPATTGINCHTDLMAASMVNMPGETPIFHQKFNITSSNIHLHGLTFFGVGTSNFGVVGSGESVNCIGLWRCTFEECYKIGTTHDNNSCFGFSVLGSGDLRERIFVSECLFKNSSDLHGYDYYSIRDNVWARNKLVFTDGTTQIESAWIFPKLGVASSDITWNVADVPNLVPATVPVAVVQLYNSWDPAWPYTSNINTKFENNYIRTATNDCLACNGSQNITLAPATMTNFVRRNTFVGGRVTTQHFVQDDSPARISVYESNVIQNSNGGLYPPPNPQPEWYQVTGTNVNGTSGIVDSLGYLIDQTNRGKSGHGVWRPT